MSGTEKPKIGLNFGPIDEDAPPSSSVREQQEMVRATAAEMSRVNGAPKEGKKPSSSSEAVVPAHGAGESAVRTSTPKTRSRPRKKTDPTVAPKPEWRRRAGRPRSQRQHPMTLKSTEEHLKFLYMLTEDNGLLIDGIEDGIVLLAEKIIRQKTWRGRAAPDEAVQAAQELLKAFPDKA